MIFDAALDFGITALTGSPGLALSTNVVDLGLPVQGAATTSGSNPSKRGLRDIAIGNRLMVQFEVTTAFTVGAGTPLLQMGMVTADSSDFVTNALWVERAGGNFVLLDFGTPYYAAVSLPLGAIINLPLAPISRFLANDPTYGDGTAGSIKGQSNYFKRFLAAAFTQPNFASANFSAGAIQARLLLDAGSGVVANIPENMQVAGFTFGDH